MTKKLFFSACLLVSIFYANAQVKSLVDTFNVPYEYNVKDWLGNNLSKVLLDIYYPLGSTSDKKYPAVVLLHGGSFIGGGKANVSDACDLFSDQGFIAFSIDYRVGYNDNSGVKCGGDTVGQNLAVYRAMQDVNAAFRFIVANAALYNVDTSALFIGGASAGGDLAFDASYINDSVATLMFPGFADTLGTLQTSGNSYPANYVIKGICGMWGAMPGRQLISPTYKAIPTILFKGGLDKSLPDGSGFASNCSNYPAIISGTGIYNRLRALNVPSVYHFHPLGFHSSHEDVFCAKMTACFFKALMNNTPYSGYYTYFNNSCQ